MSSAFDQVPAKRLSTGVFAPGHSGNPSGRPKAMREITELTRSMSVDAVKRLQFLMLNAKSEMAQIAAANAILDRAWGKPKETRDVEINHTRTSELSVRTLSDEQLEALHAALRETALTLEGQEIEGEAEEIEE